MLFACILGFAYFAQAPQPGKFAQEIIDNQRRDLRNIVEYTFEYEMITGSGNAKHKEENGEGYMRHRRSFNIPLTRDGKPIKAKDFEKRRDAVIKQLELHAKLRLAEPDFETPGPDKPGSGTNAGGIHMSSIDILRYCQLSEPKQIGQLLEVSFDLCKSPWPSEAHFPRIKGTLRIDPKDRVTDSWQARIKDGPSPGLVFFEQVNQIAPGGIRFPAVNRWIQSAAPHLFPKGRMDATYRIKNLQRFGVEVNQSISGPMP